MLYTVYVDCSGVKVEEGSGDATDAPRTPRLSDIPPEMTHSTYTPCNAPEQPTDSSERPADSHQLTLTVPVMRRVSPMQEGDSRRSSFDSVREQMSDSEIVDKDSTESQHNENISGDGRTEEYLGKQSKCHTLESIHGHSALAPLPKRRAFSVPKDAIDTASYQPFQRNVVPRPPPSRDPRKAPNRPAKEDGRRPGLRSRLKTPYGSRGPSPLRKSPSPLRSQGASPRSSRGPSPARPEVNRRSHSPNRVEKLTNGVKMRLRSVQTDLRKLSLTGGEARRERARGGSNRLPPIDPHATHREE